MEIPIPPVLHRGKTDNVPGGGSDGDIHLRRAHLGVQGCGRIALLGGLKPPPPKVHVEFDPKGIDLVGEFVSTLNDSGGDLDLGGWVLHDAASRQRRYTFPPVTLKLGDEIKVWSKAGTDDARNLCWGRSQAVWTNTRDTAVLRDARGGEIARLSFSGRSRQP